MSDEWRTIDSAPKDGSEFLAYDATTGKQDVCYIRRENGWVEAVQCDGEYGPHDGEFAGDLIVDGERLWSKITHWMPLPEPPKDQTHE